MTTPPPTPGRDARAALAARLSQMRKEAGLSGNALARAMGDVLERRYYQSRAWKIENGRLLPQEEDLRAWARATGNEQEADELMAALAEARREQAFSDVVRTRGAAAYQEQVGDLEERSTRIGEFEMGVIPGFFQTWRYAKELMGLTSGVGAWDADEAAIERAVGARMLRQRILDDPGKRIQVVLSEAALRTLLVSPPALIGQLHKLRSVLRLPSVELGIIGFHQHMPVYPFAFRVYDDHLIAVESLAGERFHSAREEPAEVAAFLDAFNVLRMAASKGDDADAIILRALGDLGAELP